MPKQSGAETLAMKNKIYMTVQESVIGAGTGNYNKLQNIPIVNLFGESPLNAVDLSGLNPGHFILNGYYKTSSVGEVEHREDPIDLYSLQEELGDGGQTVTKKVLYYIYAKNGHLYIRMMVYVGSVLETDIDVCLTKPLIYWEEEEDEDESVVIPTPTPVDPVNPSDPSDPNDPNDPVDPNNTDPNQDPNQNGEGE